MTYWNGFVAGLIAALAFEAGIYFGYLHIAPEAHLIIVILAVVFSVVITVYTVHEGSSMISPTIDGLVYGFTIFYTVLELIQGKITVSAPQT